MRTVCCIITEKGNFLEKVYAVTDRGTDGQQNRDNTLRQYAEGLKNQFMVMLLNQKRTIDGGMRSPIATKN